jgi:hypothetical protein
MFRRPPRTRFGSSQRSIAREHSLTGPTGPQSDRPDGATQMTLDPSRVAQRSPTLITATWPTTAQASGHASQIASRIATTHCPPAAQMEISPPAGSSLRQLFCKRADNATARSGEWMSGSQRGAVDVEPAPVDRAERGIGAETVVAERLALPRIQGHPHRRGEGLVDLVVVTARRPPRWVRRWHCRHHRRSLSRSGPMRSCRPPGSHPPGRCHTPAARRRRGSYEPDRTARRSPG